MIATNSAIVDFIGNNWLALSGLMGLLKILAQQSENNTDDKVVSFLSGWVGGIRKK